MKVRARKTRIRLALGLIVVSAGVAVTTLMAAGGAVAQGGPSYPRNQTLYTSGTQWGDIQGFNPFGVPFGWTSYAVGTVGLVNETLFRYDPLKDHYIPWLAQGGNWISPHTYVLKVRSGIQWSNGDPFTAADVAWNFDLGRFDTASWHGLYLQLASSGGVTVSGSVVRLKFAVTPSYAEWMTLLWNLPMVNPTQWAGVTADTLNSFLNGPSPDAPIGTGPYVLDASGYDPSTQVAWEKNPAGWWAVAAGLAPDPKPQYIVDLVNTDETNNPNAVISGLLDLSNNFFAEIPRLLRTPDIGIHTYYPNAPYYLPANTAWLVPNTTRTPLNDVQFRRALAYAVDADQIVGFDYDGAVVKASPTGLLPTWSKYIDRSLAASYGFSYDPLKARSILKAAGYFDADGDGYVENKDGTEISLTLMVPYGWTDWQTATGVIAIFAKWAGIRVVPVLPYYDTYLSDRGSGKYDLLIDNTAQISDTPWTYYDYLFRQPISEEQSNANFERFSGPVADTAWNLTRQLDQTLPSNVLTKMSIIRQLEKITMQQLPAIPLWYNGMWSQFSSRYWTSWPSSTSTRNFTPCMWRGYLQMTGIDMIDHLVPVASP